MPQIYLLLDGTVYNSPQYDETTGGEAQPKGKTGGVERTDRFAPQPNEPDWLNDTKKPQSRMVYREYKYFQAFAGIMDSEIKAKVLAFDSAPDDTPADSG